MTSYCSKAFLWTQELHTFFPRIHHKPFPAEEADERQVELPGELGREAGGSRDTGHDGNAGDPGLLDDSKDPKPLVNNINSISGQAIHVPRTAEPRDLLADGSSCFTANERARFLPSDSGIIHNSVRFASLGPALSSRSVNSRPAGALSPPRFETRDASRGPQREE